MNNWIKITDKKPDDSENVLVYIDFGGRSHEIDLALYVEDEDKFLSSDDNYIKKELITHWMPLPDGPHDGPNKSKSPKMSSIQVVTSSDPVMAKEHKIMKDFIKDIVRNNCMDSYMDEASDILRKVRSEYTPNLK
jgi:hypothetical protein